jgi:hypothetical protein
LCGGRTWEVKLVVVGEVRWVRTNVNPRRNQTLDIEIIFFNDFESFIDAQPASTALNLPLYPIKKYFMGRGGKRVSDHTFNAKKSI